MKLTYCNLDEVYLTRKGNFRDKETTASLYYFDSCKGCQEPYLAQREGYCCKSCSSTHNNGMKGKTGEANHFYGKTHTEKTKKRCGDVNRGRKHTEKTKKLYSETRKGSGNANWKGGIKYNPYSDDWTDELRKFIRKRDGLKCQEPLCEGKNFVLDVHHIDYNKLNCVPNNLITLCHSCHAKTNGNRGYFTKKYQGIVNEEITGRV